MVSMAHFRDARSWQDAFDWIGSRTKWRRASAMLLFWLPCGPWEEKEAEMGKKIRGLRRCTQRDCMLPLNRDKNGATNIGTNFLRLMGDQPTIRSMTDEDLAFHRASICMECDG